MDGSEGARDGAQPAPDALLLLDVDAIAIVLDGIHRANLGAGAPSQWWQARAAEIPPVFTSARRGVS